MRRDIREGVKQFMHDDLKPNFAAIVRQYGADYRTVKQAFTELNQDAQCKGSAKKHRPSLLDNYRHVIKAKLEDNCSAMAIFKFIQKKSTKLKGVHDTRRGPCTPLLLYSGI
nr:IS21 family transposase [Lacticaseibacillus paracasei]